MAMDQVRKGIFDSLGEARVIEIRGYALVENPMTSSELLRSSAANVEALWVTWLLAQWLPHLFVDNKASIGDNWNDERLTRETKDQKYLDTMKGQIDSGLGNLMAPVSETSGPVKASAIQNDTKLDAFNPYRGLYPKGTNASTW